MSSPKDQATSNGFATAGSYIKGFIRLTRTIELLENAAPVALSTQTDNHSRKLAQTAGHLERGNIKQ